MRGSIFYISLHFSRKKKPNNAIIFLASGSAPAGSPHQSGAAIGGAARRRCFLSELTKPINWGKIDVLAAGAASLSLTGQSSKFTALVFPDISEICPDWHDA